MKKSTKSQLLQKLHQIWCKQKHNVWALIVVSVSVFVIVAIALVIFEYCRTRVAAHSASMIVGNICMLLTTYDVWKRFFAEPGEELTIKLSVQNNSNKRRLTVQIGRAFYAFRLPNLMLIALFIIGFIIPDLMMMVLSAVGLTLVCVGVAVIGLFLIPLAALDLILSFIEGTLKKSKKTE